jgi:probable HAF family extracellular repeat protein
VASRGPRLITALACFLTTASGTVAQAQNAAAPSRISPHAAVIDRRAPAGCAGRSAPRFQIIDLGDFGGELAAAWSINDRGDVVGTAEDPDLEPTPFLWRAGKLNRLGEFGPIEAAGEALGINDHGLVVGRAFAPVPGGFGSHPFLWSAEAGMVDLTPGAATVGSARAVSSAGQVVGGIDGPSGGAILWTAQDDIVRVGLPGAPAGFTNEATDINEAGLVCGTAVNAELHLVAWVYESNTGRIRELDELGAGFSEAHGINDRGDVVGVSTRPNLQFRPVLWTHDGRMVDLGFLPVPGFSQGIARAINDDRIIVGEDHFDADGVLPRGWLWIGGRKLDLKGLIANKRQRARWDSLHPRDINERCEIVGQGVRDRIPGRAFLMRPLP